MSRQTLSTLLVLLAIVLLFGIAGSAENRPLDFTDALWATAGIALILLASWIEKGRNRL